jgi:phosphate transport system protein
MVRNSFQKEMDELKNDVGKIAEHAKNCVEKSVLSLKNQDVEMAESVFVTEDESDILNLGIDDRGMKLTALQQPVARDLRFISTMMKISDNYERICDLTVKIAEITRKTAKRPLLKPLVDIPRMARTIIEMIDINTRAMEAWKVDEAGVLEEVLQEKDDFIDALYDQVYRELLTFMIKNPRTIDDATHLLFVARDLERAGDIAAKNGARIHYMITGERIWIK